MTNIKNLFELFDENNDGYISMQELKVIFSDRSVNDSELENRKFFETIMREVDLNLDNMITYDEFNGALTNLLMDSLYNYTLSKSQSGVDQTFE